MNGGPSEIWPVDHGRGSAAALLAPWPPPDSQDRARVRIGRMTGTPALVLGSTQKLSLVDQAAAAAAGIDVLRRSTGGGAVLVTSDAQVWLDLWVPRRHPLWDDDIIRAASWLGQCWARALASLDVAALAVHRAPATRTDWSDRICFAGVGPGEVVRTVDGAKVMGLAQRRTRSGARFHTSAPLVWEPAPLLALFRGGADSPLDDVATGLRALVPPPAHGDTDADLIAAVENAVIAALP